jgi:nucleotide-binding universal stress UspA family protein
MLKEDSAMKTLLVPLDGSELAARALPYAMTLAKAADGKLILLRGVDALKMNQLPEQDAAAELDAAVERAKAGGVEAEPYLYHLYYDRVGSLIADTARQQQADLIVMSTHGRGGFGRWIYGSVADEVLREAEVPVLLVPAGCEQPWSSDRKPCIVVPLDRSELAEAALGPATELARLLGAGLFLVHVVQLPTYAYGDGYAFSQFDAEAELTEAREYVEQIAGRLRASGLSVRTWTGVDSPSLAIAAMARAAEADLIVMATHGRGGLARLVLGSVATGTLQRANVPVLVVRPATVRQPTAEPPLAAAKPSTTPELPPAGPSVSITLSTRDLDLIERGLGELLLNPDRDRQAAGPARELRARLRAVAPATAEKACVPRAIAPATHAG